MRSDLPGILLMCWKLTSLLCTPTSLLNRRQERRPASGSSLSELTVAATSELDSSLSATLAIDSSLSATLAEDVPARDPGPGPKTDAMVSSRAASAG